MSVLKSGDEYTLSQLFSGDRKIIIPDLQRDYCWGDEKHGSESRKVELVSGFVKGLIQSFEDNKDERLMLGLIYGFENPINHVHLCDGQQRITTLFLLLGMLCRKNGCKPEANHLISKFEYVDDDKEPYLQYSIRESTLYFLSDLVCYFFIENKECESVKAIKQTNWYFNSYNQDPSIQSILKALIIIEKTLDKEYDWIEFQRYVENKIFMLYFDLENRENGEDLFVIINTTGEPLTATENLKPVLLGSLSDRPDLNKQWEDREDFFWRHKKKNEHEADNGHLDFITWYIKIKNKTNEVKIFDYFKKIVEDKTNSLEEELANLQKYFEHFKDLVSYFEEPSFKQILSGIRGLKENSQVIYTRDFTKDSESTMQQQNILLPLLYFTAKISSDKNDIYLFLRRLRKNYFDKEFDKRDGEYLDWRYILQIISKKNSLEDILTYQPLDNQLLNSIANVEDYSADWYNSEEQLKDRFKFDTTNKQKIERWENHPDFMGELRTLFKIHLIDSSMSKIPLLPEEGIEFPNIEFSDLEKYYENYENLEKLMFETNAPKNPNLANYYRLFKVIVNCNKISKIYRTRGIEGVKFSTKNRNHLASLECLRIYKAENVLEYLKSYILNYSSDNDVFNITESLFSASKLIKSWLILKVFNAEVNKALLAYWDGNDTGISAYKDFSENLIFVSQPRNIENLICGFAVKSGGAGGNYISYTKDTLWLGKDILDTPFAGISYTQFCKRSRLSPSNADKAITANKNCIDQLLAINLLKSKDYVLI